MANNKTKDATVDYYSKPLSMLKKAKKLATESYDKDALTSMSNDLAKFPEEDAKTRFEEIKRLIDELWEFSTNKKKIYFILNAQLEKADSIIRQCLVRKKLNRHEKLILITEEIIDIMFEMKCREGAKLGMNFYKNLKL